ncbi:amino acid adenylation domain-containing protein [Streptosporangium sandarakinum]|uniref:amino acid adenylation domain-containing protein n=1 Tax=Streptosporangium sandarakinum TaxID=1260955 RepID=UPI003D8A8395
MTDKEGAHSVSSCLHHLFEEQVLRTPDAVALTIGGVDVSYLNLWKRANHLALELQRVGAGPETFVGVPADRSVDALVAMLGVLKSGAAYVPFAANLPRERLRHIVADAKVDIFAGSRRALQGIPSGRLIPADERATAEPPSSSVTPDNAAYVIYTSGSTGPPKGVITPHRQIVGSTLARFTVFPRPCSSYLMLAPFTFDAAAAGVYLTLSTGGRLVVPTDEEVLDPALLAKLIVEERATHVDGVPSQYAALLAFHPEALSEVRCTILAGEALPVPLAQRHFAVAPDTELFNEYGPTEGTVWSTVHRCARHDVGSMMPIGHPIRGVRVHLLNEDLDESPPGEIGEIYIAGAGVARGYLNRPGLTAARFLPNPYAGKPGERMYRTGDLGMINERGELVFCGRADDQIKVRGFRVEPGEIESRLLAHSKVAAAAVIAYGSETGTRLAGFVVPAREGAPSGTELSSFLSAWLPDYMIPGRWQMVSELPLTAHGKVDRHALAASVRATGSAHGPRSSTDDVKGLGNGDFA